MTFCGLLLGFGLLLMSQMSSLLHLYILYRISKLEWAVPLCAHVSQRDGFRRRPDDGIVAAGSGRGVDRSRLAGSFRLMAASVLYRGAASSCSWSHYFPSSSKGPGPGRPGIIW
jgi:hypothetical protein